MTGPDGRHEALARGDLTILGRIRSASNATFLCEAGRDGEAVLVASFDREQLRTQRAAWGLFRDRRPELYGPIVTLDGTSGITTRVSR